MDLTQVMTIAGAIVAALAGAIGVLFKMVITQAAKLETRWESCEKQNHGMQAQLIEIAQKASLLEGRVHEMERLSPGTMADLIMQALNKSLKP